MQSNSTSASILEGDGIYCGQTGTIDIETLPLSLSVAQQTVQATTIVGLETKTHPNHDEILRLDGNLTRNEQEKLDNRELPEIDSILTALDEQVQVLEGLKRRIKSPSCSEKSVAHSNFNTQQDPFQFPYARSSLKLRRKKSTATKSVNSQASDSSSAQLTRQLLLDGYIKSSIEENEHECGCRYHLALERRLGLLDELDDCYRRFSHSQSASSSPSRKAAQESDERPSSRGQQQQVRVTAGPTREAAVAAGAAYPRAAAVASDRGELCGIGRAASVSEADRRPCARLDSAAALATSTSARRSPSGSSSRRKVKRARPRGNFDEGAFSGAQDRARAATVALAQPQPQPQPQQAELGAEGLFIDSGRVHSFTAKSSEQRARTETGAASYHNERQRDREYSSERALHRAVREWQASCEVADDDESSHCVSPLLSAPHSSVGFSENVRSFSDNDSRAPKTSCNCCCHLRSTATLSSSGGSCCSSDQFEVRSALDCVEDSPPNNNNNNTLHQQDRNPASLSGGRGKCEPQLDCSLTSDSAASLQESASFALIAPSPSSVYSQDKAHFDRPVRGVVECASSTSSERAEGPVRRQLSVWPLGRSMELAGENIGNKSIGFCGNKSKTQRFETQRAHLSSTNNPNDERVDGELRDHKRTRQDTAKSSECPPEEEEALRLEQLDNDELEPGANSQVPKSHNLAPERRGLKRLRHSSPTSSSSSFDSATNVTASNNIEQQKRPSMRAAKDLVKLSVPSLSALQYLPGQMESRPARLADETSKRQRMVHDKSGAPTTKMQRQTGQIIDRGKSISTPPSQEVGELREEPRAASSPSKADASNAEAVERDAGPCLLHRLCLCNCMTRNHSDVKKPRSDGATPPPPPPPPTATAAQSEPSSSSPSHGKSASWQLRRRLRPAPSSESAKEGASRELESLVSGNKEVAAEKRQRCQQLGDITGEILNEELGGEGKDLGGVGGRRSAGGRLAAGARDQQEKQSPKFLGLLAQASVALAVAASVGGPTQEQQDERDRSGASRQREVAKKAGGHPLKAKPTKTPLRHENHDKLLGARTALVGSDGLGSIGDLATASGRSSSASGSHTNSDLVSSLLSQCNTKSSKSSSFNSKSGRRSADILSESASCERDRPISSPSATSSPEPASQCPHQNQSQQHPNQPQPHHHHQKRKVSSYRKLLSPSKLFSSTSTSSICEHCQQGESEQHPPEKTSFLSRSLGRLSGRKSPLDRQRTLSASQAREQTTRSSCVSPNLSVSNDSQADTNFSDSINDSSIDEPNSNSHSLPYQVNRELFIHRRHQQEPTASKSSTRLLKAPEIVLSEAKYQDVDGDSHTSDRMTRSTSGASGQQRNTQISQSARNKDNSFFERPAPQRHGSEISFASSNPDSDSLAHGPFSLPGSPRSSRRRRNPSRRSRLSQSPVPLYSPASESTKIEDGLKVCSTEHFEKHIGNIKDNQIEAQKRLFTAWINHFAPNLIRHDLFVELQDGIKLIGLLAALTHDRHLLAEHDRLTHDRQSYINRLVLSPQSRLKHLHTVNMAIEYMRKSLGMKLVGLNAMDIVDAKANVILGLCWSIILNFQLDQGILKNSNNSSQNSGSYCASYLSFGSATGDERSNGRARSAANLYDRRKLPTLEDEYSPKDLAAARGKLLAHINKRFNLRLTNLTSSLIDGDVLMAIIKQLLPADTKLPESRLATWSSLKNDDVAKLEFCFELANDYLNVPRLVSASDLIKRTICANDTKPLLVYLSMLLKSNPRQCSTDQMLELRRLDESLETTPTPTQRRQLTFTTRPMAASGGAIAGPEEPQSATDRIVAALKDIDTEDKFHIDKLQATLVRVEQLDQMRQQQEPSSPSQGSEALDETVRRRLDALRGQAEQVESLIVWINRADRLFEAKQRSSSDLAKAIEEYQSFFSRDNLPQVDTSLCPTLERQYRECIATARQRVLSMEQTMKNWISYEQTRQELRNWLQIAENKLVEALRPGSGAIPHSSGAELASNGQIKQEASSDPVKASPSQDDPVAQHMSRLDELIDYFELEQVEMDDFDCLSGASLPSNSMHDEMSYSSLSIYQANNSLSGSLLSLGSTGSRMSTLASSKQASYNRLFDNFELNCRLLAAQLEPEQRDGLLMGVKELKSRLKYIVDHKVPQVVGEIRMSISRCEMSIKEQDELVEELEGEEKGLEGDIQLHEINGEEEEVDAKEVEDSDSGPLGSPEPVSEEHAVVRDGKKGVLRSATNKSTSTRASRRTNSKNRAMSRQSKRAHSSKENSVAKNVFKISAKSAAIDDDDDHDECGPFYRALWNKVCRASKLGMSFSIVLLICLAGICILPLIQKDACCELSQESVRPDRFTFNQRPV